MVQSKKKTMGLALIAASLSCAPAVVQTVPETPAEEPVYVQEIAPENFDDVILESGIPVVVDFYFEGCVSCPKLKPVFEEACRDFYGRVKCVSFDAFQDDYATAETYGIDGYPIILPFCHGEVGEEIKVWDLTHFSGDRLHENLEELVETCP